MKSIALVFFIIAGIHGVNAKSIDSATVVIFGKSYTLHVGDTLQIGYGANPDGSFMYIYSGAGDSKQGMDKSLAGKTVVIKKIRYYKHGDITEIFIRGKGIQHLAQVPQAFEKKEIIRINGTSL